MKKAFLYGMITLLIGVMTYILFQSQSEKPDVIKTVKKAYVLSSHDTLRVDLYLNRDDHPLTFIDSIANLSIETDMSRVAVELKDIRKSREEIYLSETYSVYQYHIELPIFDELVILDPAYLLINFVDGSYFRLEIGKISTYPSAPDRGHLTWLSLSGSRYDHAIYPRIGIVSITFESMEVDLISFFDGFSESEHFVITEDTLYLYIANENYLYDAFPIRLTFEDGTTQQIPYFVYMFNYAVLSESGPLTFDIYDPA